MSVLATIGERRMPDESPESAFADSGIGPLRCNPVEIVELVTMAIEAGGSAWVRANSHSMAPTICFGADVCLESPRDLTIGTVVLAMLPRGLLVLHRIYAIDGDRILLRGDASGIADPAVVRSAVLARARVMSVKGVEREIGPRPWISMHDVKRWLRPLTSRARNFWRAMRSAGALA